MRTITLQVLPVVVSCVLLMSCMPSAQNSGSTAEEYVYKGRPDQLLSEPSVNRAAKLSERFKLIQARQ